MTNFTPVRWVSFFRCFLLAAVMLLTIPQAAAAAEPLILTGEVAYINLEGGFYGIIGDDGQTNQPTNLSKQLRKPGLPIKFTAASTPNSFSSFMWGTVITIQSATKLEPPLLGPERAAIQLQRQRMTAFNTKNLALLQQIDSSSKQLQPEQFQEWLGDYHTFTLRFVDIDYHDRLTITGVCIYTRESSSPAATEISQLKFTLERTKSGWIIAKTKSEPCAYTLAEVIEAATLKYGTADLATLWQ